VFYQSQQDTIKRCRERLKRGYADAGVVAKKKETFLLYKGGFLFICPLMVPHFIFYAEAS